MTVTARAIIDTLAAALAPLDVVNAMWLGGSAATGRTDELSDVDIQIDVADGRVADAFAAAEAALAALSPIELCYPIPEPTWHGHSQRFYRLEDSPEHLLVDFCVLQRGSSAPRFLEREIHGEPVVVFDKLGIVHPVPVDRAAHRRAMRKDLSSRKARFLMFHHLPRKEIVRQNHADAVWRYFNFVLSPLIVILRARHAPLFYDFAPRYLRRDLPADVCDRLTRLHFVADVADLAAKTEEAIAWALDELRALEIDEDSGAAAGDNA
jgi:predicted nucleotidyltransferase